MRAPSCVVEATRIMGLFDVHVPWMLLGMIPAGLHKLLGGKHLPKEGDG